MLSAVHKSTIIWSLIQTNRYRCDGGVKNFYITSIGSIHVGSISIEGIGIGSISIDSIGIGRIESISSIDRLRNIKIKLKNIKKKKKKK